MHDVLAHGRIEIGLFVCHLVIIISCAVVSSKKYELERPVTPINVSRLLLGLPYASLFLCSYANLVTWSRRHSDGRQGGQTSWMRKMGEKLFIIRNTTTLSDGLL